VVTILGGGSVTPFTTPNQACKRGLDTDKFPTALGDYRLAKEAKMSATSSSQTAAAGRCH
jgi:hypothetical protein